MKYGDFSEDSREYIITNPETPTPWINYISNPRGYCGIVSQSGGGFSFHKDPRDRRITKYRYNNVPVDRPGRYFYVRDNGSSDFFSPTYQPVMKKPDDYKCRHGQGYTIIETVYGDIQCETLYFVPADFDMEVWRLSVRNTGNTRKRLSIYSYSEFTFWCEPESRNIQWSLHLTRGLFVEEMVQYAFIEPHPAFDMKANANYVADRQGFAFMGMNAKVADFECARDRFLGMYGSETDPIGVRNGKLACSKLEGGIGCAALRTEVELQPGEEKAIIVVLGFAEKTETAVSARKYFSDNGNVDKELSGVRESWTKYFSGFSLESDEKDLNLMVNVWNQYQCKTTFDWSRYISFYENGEGRGMGTRDSSQDTLAIVGQMPGQCRNRIFQIISTCQFETGDCYHQFFPLGGKGDLKGFSDDHLWLVQMVHAYIAETGDTGILDEPCGFADSMKTAIIYEHLVAAVNYTARMVGPHGLPLILTADWNDTLHLWMEFEKPESVLTAEFYVHALNQLSELAKRMGKKADATGFESSAKCMSKLVNDICWDGEWYIRGFGKKAIGTSASERAKIFLNSQSWAVISGVASPERGKIAMDSVRKHLASEEGVKNIWPCFEKYDGAYGLISRYVPGRKENGIFAHANAWAIIAEAILDRPEIAFDYYRKIIPMKNNDNAEILKTEPYVFCQTICSNDSIDKGEGANSWLTGTASWMYVAATQYILGIKPAIDGLRINPCIPKSMEHYKVTRQFRGCNYEITVNKGTENKLSVNGKYQKELLVAPQSGLVVRVDAEIV
jgi:cellobiose phosphorylase